MPGLVFPPFPDNVPTHPLLVIDYELVEAGDKAEIDRLWKAATDLGFWYLKAQGISVLIDDMFTMGGEVMDLSLEEKFRYEQGDEGGSFGYKAAGENITDEAGARDTAEFINIAKDDALAYPNVVHRSYMSAVNDRMQSTITPFVQLHTEYSHTLLRALEGRLGLPPGTMRNLHEDYDVSSSEARAIKNPPVGQKGMSLEKLAVGAHTDFGSLSFLHNRLGGLQVLVPGSEEWLYIKPLPGHLICNVGDALKILTGGILQSNMHRVIAPPGQQAFHERWSIVYFSRPANNVPLRPLLDSPLIAKAAESLPPSYVSGETAREWFTRRVKYYRIRNMTGPDTWMASRGTEHRLHGA